MIFRTKHLVNTFLYLIQGPKFWGGGSPSQSSTVTQATIPEELKPYISTYMGAAEKQLYQKNAAGKVTGFQPYKAYGATFDKAGNQTGYDPAKGIAQFSDLQNQAFTGAANLQTPSNFGTATNLAGASGAGQLGTAGTAAQYGTQGYQSGQLGQSIGATGGLGYGAQGANLGMAAAGQAGQGYNAGAKFAQQMTDPNSVNAYMSPYVQNVMNQQIGAANRAYDITGAEQQGRATQAGAFGGSREALMAAENERNRNTAIGGIQATGYQNAFTNAQQQQKNVADIGLQGMGAGNQAIQTGLSGIGQGITGVNTALQGYQQGVSGAQAGLAGVSAEQAGYAGAGQAAGTLSNIGTQALAADTNVLATQDKLGAEQTAREQTIKDQALLDYQNAMNKPMQDIGTMSNLVRGAPLNNASATTYAPAPSALSQIGGLAATGIGAYGALKANGGVIEDRGYASGGIVGYATGGSVEGSMRNKLEDLDTSHLQEIIKENESPEMTKLAKEVLAKNYAKGGIVAFADELNKPNGSLVSKTPEQIRLEQKLAVDKAASQGGIAVPMQQTQQAPVQQAAPVDPIASLQASSGVAEKEAAIPVEERIQQQKALEEKFVGKDTETDAYRKSIMDERANAPDEAKRQMYMRLMEFGANWGSTPGAPLAAGLKAITSTLPGVMEDNKANKKMMRELNRAEYDLNHAARLEELGHIDKATAQKEKSQETLMKYKDKLVDAGLKQQQLEQEATIAREKNASQERQQDTSSSAHLTGVRETINAGITGNKQVDREIDNLQKQQVSDDKRLAALKDTGEPADLIAAKALEVSMDEDRLRLRSLLGRPKTADELEHERFAARRKEEKK